MASFSVGNIWASLEDETVVQLNFTLRGDDAIPISGNHLTIE
jgi:hypothetical protein